VKVRLTGAALIAFVAIVAMTIAVGAPAGSRPADSPGLLPDLRTVVPLSLGIQNQQQREYLRFANGIANTGAGDWRLRPDPPPRDNTTTLTTAVQEILDASGNVVQSRIAGIFVFHPEHNHWHIGEVAQFEVRVGSPNGPVLVNDQGIAQSIKTTFCLVDRYTPPGDLTRLGRSVSPVARGPETRHHGCQAGPLLPRLDRELRGHVPRGELHEQHSVAVVRADARFERESEDRACRPFDL
jgi:hypothetical protein